MCGACAQARQRAVQVLTRETGPFRDAHRVGAPRAPGGKDVFVSIGMGETRWASAWAASTRSDLRARWRWRSLRFVGKADIYVSKNAPPRRKCWCRRGAWRRRGVPAPTCGASPTPLADGESAQVFIANADGASPRAAHQHALLHQTPAPPGAPAGESSRSFRNRGCTPQVYLMSSEAARRGGSPSRQLTTRRPTGARAEILIAFTARDERNAFDLFTIAVESGKVTRLTRIRGTTKSRAFRPTAV